MHVYTTEKYRVLTDNPPLPDIIVVISFACLKLVDYLWISRTLLKYEMKMNKTKEYFLLSALYKTWPGVKSHRSTCVCDVAGTFVKSARCRLPL